MRISEASRKKKFEYLLSTLPQPIAELAAEVAAVPSSRTSMTMLATALVRHMVSDFEQKYQLPADASNHVPIAGYVEDVRSGVMEVVDWAASVGDAWKGESSFEGMLSKAKEWHDALAANADETAGYVAPDETVADLGNGWRIVKINPHNAKAEGDIMGHCFARYKDDLWEGRKIGFSIRDGQNRPHVTFNVKRIGSIYQDKQKTMDVVARNLARRQVQDRIDAEVEEVMGGDPYLNEGEVRRNVEDRWAQKVEDIARELKSKGKVPEYEIEQVQAKGNTAPPDKYRPALAKFIEESNFYCSDQNRRNLVPSDELIEELRSSEDPSDMIRILYEFIPTARRAEALDISIPRLEYMSGWAEDLDDFGSLLSVLIDELEESPNNLDARDHLDDLLAEELHVFRGDDLDYLHKKLVNVMGGERWIAALLDSDDSHVVAAGLHIAETLRLKENPTWNMALSNAAAKTTLMSPNDNEMWAFDTDAYEDPVERLRDLGQSFEGSTWSNDSLYDRSKLGRQMRDLYRDSPAEFEEFLKRIPYRFLKDWWGLPGGEAISNGGLFEVPPGKDSSWHVQEDMNQHIKEMVKRHTRDSERNEKIQRKEQLSLFASLVSRLDETDPQLADRIDRHFLGDKS